MKQPDNKFRIVFREEEFKKEPLSDAAKEMVRKGVGCRCLTDWEGRLSIKEILTFEIEELDNKHILHEASHFLDVEPDLDAIVTFLEGKFSDGEAVWLSSKEDAMEVYGCDEDGVLCRSISEDCQIVSDLAKDGVLFVWISDLGMRYVYHIPPEAIKHIEALKQIGKKDREKWKKMMGFCRTVYLLLNSFMSFC